MLTHDLFAVANIVLITIMLMKKALRGDANTARWLQ